MNKICTLILIIITSFGLFHCGSSDQNVNRVLLITLDTVRADALSCYDLSTSAANTKHLNQLAVDGTLFLRASCNIPATLTSHTSIMSGRLPRSTGVRFAKDQVPKTVETLAETLKMEGYSTAAFLSAAVLNKMFGLNQGFDVYNDLSVSIHDESERSGEQTTDLAIEWLQLQPPDESIFLWVHYYDAHSPYHPSAEFDHYRDPSYSGSITGSANQVTQLVANKGQGINQDDLDQLRALYLGEVEYMDHHIGRLIKAFDASGDVERNMVVAIADHGENLGENGRYFHGADLYGQSMHIPFIIRWGNQQHNNTKVRELVQGIDVMPTVLTACGITSPAEVEGINLQELFGSNHHTPRVSFQETEDEYRSDADKIFAAESLDGRLIDHRFSRRSPVLIGRSVNIEIRDSCFLQAYINGDPSIEIAAHIRFHTSESWENKESFDASTLPNIMVYSSRFGIEAVHNQHPVDEIQNWEPIATPDLYQHCLSYAEAQNWDVDHIVFESVVVNLSGVPGQTRVDAFLDQFELRGKQNNVIDTFDWKISKPFVDSGVGKKILAGSIIEQSKGINNTAALHVAATFSEDENIWEQTEFFAFQNVLQPYDENNRLNGLKPEQFPEETKKLANDLADWLISPPGQPMNTIELDPAQEEKLRSLGYF